MRSHRKGVQRGPDGVRISEQHRALLRQPRIGPRGRAALVLDRLARRTAQEDGSPVQQRLRKLRALHRSREAIIAELEPAEANAVRARIHQERSRAP